MSQTAVVCTQRQHQVQEGAWHSNQLQRLVARCQRKRVGVQTLRASVSDWYCRQRSLLSMLAKPLMARRARGATSFLPPVHINPQARLLTLKWNSRAVHNKDFCSLKLQVITNICRRFDSTIQLVFGRDYNTNWSPVMLAHDELDASTVQAALLLHSRKVNTV